jgi:hypothetical protein
MKSQQTGVGLGGSLAEHHSSNWDWSSSVLRFWRGWPTDAAFRRFLSTSWRVSLSATAG